MDLAGWGSRSTVAGMLRDVAVSSLLVARRSCSRLLSFSLALYFEPCMCSAGCMTWKQSTQYEKTMEHERESKECTPLSRDRVSKHMRCQAQGAGGQCSPGALKSIPVLIATIVFYRLFVGSYERRYFQHEIPRTQYAVVSAVRH